MVAPDPAIPVNGLYAYTEVNAELPEKVHHAPAK
jgi:hypothetical protein